MDIYTIIVGMLIVLAILDLIVGVSNDAINFLNSALGSKVFSFRTIIITAGLGVFFGAVFSSGMMEVARKGIFHPQMFTFHDIMIVFSAVMLTDIIMLDTFNRLGLPTSTTVSVVFELLGSAVAVSLWKIRYNPEMNIANLADFINSSKALAIIGGIFFSIVVAFTVAAIVQFFARMVFTFQFDENKRLVSVSLFGGIAFASIAYFIILKGLKGTPFYDEIAPYIKSYADRIIYGSFILGIILSYVIQKFLRYNVFHLVILAGTFSLALAFAGNDLVNFVGVPIAGFNSYQLLHAAGGDPHSFMMSQLADKVPTPTIFLLIAGAVMVLTLWFSKKAMHVAETALNLSAQGDTDEKFESNLVARSIVRSAIGVNYILEKLIPAKVRRWIDSRFQVPFEQKVSKKLHKNAPDFDLVRASINLIVAAILISLGTARHLPLSTTYVTFMVAMGSSLADRAWGRESAVYRIAGVINVITGWFATALVAFTVSALIASILFAWGLWLAIPVFLLDLYLIYVNHLKFKEKEQEETENVFNILEVVNEDVRKVLEYTFDKLTQMLDELKNDYAEVVNGLHDFDVNQLIKVNKDITKFFRQANKLRNQLYYLLQHLQDEQQKIGSNYIKLINRVQDVIQSIHFISKASKDYVNNNHHPLLPGQLEELETISRLFSEYIENVEEAYRSRDFVSLKKFYKTSADLDRVVDEALANQIRRIKEHKVDAKNSSFYMSLLNESKDLIDSFRRILKISAKLNKPFSKAKKPSEEAGMQ